MASQHIGDSAAFEWNSFVRGYHFYCQQWTTTVGDLLSLNQEPKNFRDRFAVAVRVWRCHAYTAFTVAVPALTDLSSYFSEISVVV